MQAAVVAIVNIVAVAVAAAAIAIETIKPVAAVAAMVTVVEIIKPVAEIDKIDILVAGGGLNGLIAGLVSARAGSARAGSAQAGCYSVVIVEQQPQAKLAALENDGRASTIAATSYKLLEDLGLGEALRPHAEPIWDIRVTEGDIYGNVSKLFLHFSAQELKNIPKDQPFGYVIENYWLRKILQEAVENTPNLRLIYDGSVTEIFCDIDENTHQAEAIINEAGKQTRYHTSLIIACDGKNSPLRRAQGIAVRQWEYRQKALVTAIFHEHSHQGVAVEQFMAGGPFALLPMTMQRSAIVWAEKADGADHLAALADDDFLLLLKERMGDWLGDVALAAPRQVFPLNYSHAKQYYRHRFLLLGDSAHAIHPLAGQGLNLGLRDSGTLWQILDNAHRLGLDIGREEVLCEYQAGRVHDNHAVSAMTDILNRLFTSGLPPVRTRSEIRLGGCESHHTAKTLFCQTGNGDSLRGDILTKGIRNIVRLLLGRVTIRIPP